MGDNMSQLYFRTGTLDLSQSIVLAAHALVVFCSYVELYCVRNIHAWHVITKPITSVWEKKKKNKKKKKKDKERKEGRRGGGGRKENKHERTQKQSNEGKGKGARKKKKERKGSLREKTLALALTHSFRRSTSCQKS